MVCDLMEVKYESRLKLAEACRGVASSPSLPRFNLFNLHNLISLQNDYTYSSGAEKNNV